jgi:hypothetical protein
LEKNPIHVWTVWHPVVSADTYRIHWDIFLTKKGVYWGVIHDDEYPTEYLNVLDEFLPKLCQQLENSVPTFLFISHLDPRTDFFRGEILEMKKGSEFAGWEDSELVPNYYKNIEASKAGVNIDFWFLLSDFDKIDHSIFKNACPINYRRLDRSKFGKAGRPYPCACDFEGEAELQTLAEVTPSEDVDISDQSIRVEAAKAEYPPEVIETLRKIKSDVEHFYSLLKSELGPLESIAKTLDDDIDSVPAQIEKTARIIFDYYDFTELKMEYLDIKLFYGMNKGLAHFKRDFLGKLCQIIISKNFRKVLPEVYSPPHNYGKKQLYQLFKSL